MPLILPNPPHPEVKPCPKDDPLRNVKLSRLTILQQDWMNAGYSELGLCAALHSSCGWYDYLHPAKRELKAKRKQAQEQLSKYIRNSLNAAFYESWFETTHGRKPSRREAYEGRMAWINALVEAHS